MMMMMMMMMVMCPHTVCPALPPVQNEARSDLLRKELARQVQLKGSHEQAQRQVSESVCVCVCVCAPFGGCLSMPSYHSLH